MSLTPTRRSTRLSSVSKDQAPAEKKGPQKRTLRSRSVSTEIKEEIPENDLLSVKKTLSVHNLPTIQENAGTTTKQGADIKNSSFRRGTKSTSAIENSVMLSRKLTRSQKKILESAFIQEEEENDVFEERAPNLPLLNPIILLDKTDFGGNRDPDEVMSTASSFTNRSEISRQRSASEESESESSGEFLTKYCCFGCIL